VHMKKLKIEKNEKSKKYRQLQVPIIKWESGN